MENQPNMPQGKYTIGVLCKCRHSYKFHKYGECAKCNCKEFEYIKDWRKKNVAP